MEELKYVRHAHDPDEIVAGSNVYVQTDDSGIWSWIGPIAGFDVSTCTWGKDVRGKPIKIGGTIFVENAK